MNALRAAAEYIRGAGVERVYGLPGEDHMALLHELDAAGLTYVLARDESAAVIMAATEAVATGVPGVAVVTFAPGVTNAVNGLAHAHFDHVPLLLITGRHESDRDSLIVRQKLDGQRLVASITKWTGVLSPRVNQIMRKAFDLASSPPGGPVYLEVADELVREECVDESETWKLSDQRHWSTEESGDAVASLPPTVESAIVNASRPVIVLGGHPYSARFGEALAEYAVEHRCPVLATPAAKGTLASDHPWFAGTFLGGKLEGQLLADADAVIAFDLDAFDFFNGTWSSPAQLVSIESTPLAQDVYPSTNVSSQPLPALRALRRAREQGSASTWPDRVAEIQRETVARILTGGATEPMNVPRAIAVLAECAPRSTRVAVDAGFSKQILAHLWPVFNRRAYHTAHGLSTMGFAIPAANALKLVDPATTVVGFMGDGSFLMRATEMGVAAELDLDPIYVVFADETLGQIQIKQTRQKLSKVGVTFPRPGYAQLADALGVRSAEASTAKDLRSAFLEALESSEPYLVVVNVNSEESMELFEAIRQGGT